MKTEWLIFAENESLIVFCSGWGMDSGPFRPLKSNNHDVLVCYDYTAQFRDNNIRELAGIYQHIYLIGWSMGVYYGQKHFNEMTDAFTKTIAINGTLHPIDDLLGIPEQRFHGTLAGLNEKTLLKFYRRMCRANEVFEQFMMHKPERSISDLREELRRIQKDADAITWEKSIYDDIFISSQDMIFPTANQNRFWQEGNITSLPGGHFPFYLWESWDQIVAEQFQKAVQLV